MWAESLMDINRTNRNITRDNNLMASLLFIFIIGLIVAGTLIQQAHAQSEDPPLSSKTFASPFLSAFPSVEA